MFYVCTVIQSCFDMKSQAQSFLIRTDPLYWSDIVIIFKKKILFILISTVVLFSIVGVFVAFSDEGTERIFPIFLLLIFFTMLAGAHRGIFAILENRKVSYMLDYAAYQKHQSEVKILTRINFDKLDFDYQQDSFVVTFSAYTQVILDIYPCKPDQMQDWEGWEDQYAEDMYFTSFFGLTLKRILLVATLFYGMLLGGTHLLLFREGIDFLSPLKQLLQFVGIPSVAAMVFMITREVLSFTEVEYTSNKSWQVVKISLFCGIFLMDPTTTIYFLQEMD